MGKCSKCGQKTSPIPCAWDKCTKNLDGGIAVSVQFGYPSIHDLTYVRFCSDICCIRWMTKHVVKPYVERMEERDKL